MGADVGNLQELYKLVGGEGRPPIRYEDLYFVRMRASGCVEIDEQSYGGRNSLDPATP